VSPVRDELGFYIPEDGTLHSHRLENLRSYKCVRVGGMQIGKEPEALGVNETSPRAAWSPT
jgi:hypothetical protein